MIFLSIFGIATLVLLARALGFAKNPPLDAATATTAVKAALPGFAAADVAVDAGTRTATVSGRDGRVARVTPHGDRWVVRLDERRP
jgi:HSP20 family molecular chaperone IbpA